MNASSAPSSCSSSNVPLLDLVARFGRELEQHRARDAGEDAEVERGREERLAAPPPDVRRRPFEHDAVAVDEDGVVGAAPPRLRLGGHVDRIARRLDAREQPRRLRARRRAARSASAPRARSSSRWSGTSLTSASAVGEGVQKRRSTASGVPAAASAAAASLSSSRGVHRREAEPLGRGREPLEVLLEPERRAAVDAQRLERRRGRAGAPRRRRAGRARRGRRRRAPRRRPRAASSRRSASTGAPIAASSGRAFVHDSSISASGSESQTIPPPTQRWMRPSATANVRIVSASSRSPFPRTTPSAPIEAPRPTGSSAAIWSSAAIFGAPVTEPPGNVAARSSASVASSRSVPSTVETRWVTPASSRSAISSGQRTEPGSQTRERSFRSRSTIITCSAASFSPSTCSPSGRVPLIGHVQTRRPRRARKSSGEAETIAQPSPASVRGANDAERARRARRDRPRTARRGAGRGSPGRRRRARSPRAPPRPRRRTPRPSSSAPTRRSGTVRSGRVSGTEPVTSRTATAARGSGHGSGGAGAAVRRSGSESP